MAALLPPSKKHMVRKKRQRSEPVTDQSIANTSKAEKENIGKKPGQQEKLAGSDIWFPTCTAPLLPLCSVHAAVHPPILPLSLPDHAAPWDGTGCAGKCPSRIKKYCQWKILVLYPANPALIFSFFPLNLNLIARSYGCLRSFQSLRGSWRRSSLRRQRLLRRG